MPATKPRPLTQRMTAVLLQVVRRNGWYRAANHGERVTLAALETRGYLERRPWRGDGISRDSAFEYRLPLALWLKLHQGRRRP